MIDPDAPATVALAHTEESPSRPVRILDLLDAGFRLAPADFVIVDVPDENREHVTLTGEAKSSHQPASTESEFLASLRRFVSGEAPKRPFASPWQNDLSDAKMPKTRNDQDQEFKG